MYRIAQEALRNVAKHAPGAAVRIELHRSDSELRLCIEDSGPGFAFTRVRDRGGLGLLSMQERARAAGGRLQMHTQPGRGTSVTVLLPLKEESRAS
jgi:signal transduction histidine kinase